MKKLCKVIPYGERILVSPFKEEEWKGRIQIPEAHKKVTSAGRVIGVGEDLVNHFDEGDIVLFSEFSGDKIVYEGTELWFMMDTDILGKIDEEKEK